MALRSGDKAAIKAEMERQVEAMSSFISQPFPEADKLACKSETAELLLETAMAWHLEATGSDGVRGTGDEKTMDLAADLYERAVRAFSRADFEALRFPRIVKEDWPTRAKIAYLMADLLYARKRWDKCGPAFDAAFADDPRGPLAAESSYTSAICYQNLYHAFSPGERRPGGPEGCCIDAGARPGSRAARAHGDRERDAGLVLALPLLAAAARDRQRRERAPRRGGLCAGAHLLRRSPLGGGRRGLPRDRPPSPRERGGDLRSAALPRGPQRAWLLHGARRVLRRHEPRRAPAGLGLLRGERAKENASQCGSLLVVQRDLLWRDAEMAVNKRDPASIEAGANLYMAIWAKYGKEACATKQPSCERMDQVLTNAARAFQAARFVAKAIATRKLLVDPHYNLDRTELARKAVYEIGANYQAIAVYDEAASWYERFARESPRLEHAAEAQEDAVILRLGLGQEEQAMKDAELFERTYGSQKPALSGPDRLRRRRSRHRARGLCRRGKEAVRGDARHRQERFHRRADPGPRPARAGAEQDGRSHRRRRRVRAGARRLQGSGGRGEADRRCRRERAPAPDWQGADGGGEAKFFFAEQKRRTADRVRFPEYKGSGSRADVLAHVNTKVADWIKRKRPLIEEAEKAYLEILNLPIAPPPRWSIAAGARVGQMWGKFVAEFRAAPVPAEWKKTGPSPIGDLSWEEILGTYLDNIDRASDPSSSGRSRRSSPASTTR